MRAPAWMHRPTNARIGGDRFQCRIGIWREYDHDPIGPDDLTPWFSSVWFSTYPKSSDYRLRGCPYNERHRRLHDSVRAHRSR